MIRLLLIGYLLLPCALWGQKTDTLPAGDTLEQIIALRHQLIQAVRSDDPAATTRLTERLRYLTTPQRTTLAWDERWMLYHYTSRYALLLDEVYFHLPAIRWLEESAPVQPPTDSLFEALDALLYERRDTYFEPLTEALLTEEQRAFLLLHYAYLLRDNSDDEQTRRANFLKKYPNSRYNTFIRNYLQLPVEPRKDAWTFDIELANHNWRSELERTLRSGWGGSFGLGYWKNRWSFGGQLAATGQRTTRDLPQFEGQIWPSGESSTYFSVGLQLGYDLINGHKIRVFPTLEGGWASLSPTNEEEEDTADAILYRSYAGGYYGGALNADIKLGRRFNPANVPQTGYQSIRVRAGYHFLPLSTNEPLLAGNVFFVAIGFAFLGQ